MGIDSLVAAGRSSMFKPLQYPPPRYCSGRVMVAPAAFTPGRARTRSSNCWKNDAIWGFLYFADGNGILHVNTLSGLKPGLTRSEEHTSELQSPCNLVCRLLLEKKKIVRTDTVPTYHTRLRLRGSERTA